MKPSTPARLNAALAWVLLVFLVAPALVAIPVSLTPERFLSFPSGEFSLRHYEKLFGSPEWMSSFWQSAVIGTASTALATAIGTLCAIGLWRVSSKAGEVVRAVLLLPLVIPPIIAAMAFYRLFVPLGLIDSYPGLILAHTVLSAPLVLITVSASLAGFDARLEQASRNLGASSWTTMRRVILPGITAHILTGVRLAIGLIWIVLVPAEMLGVSAGLGYYILDTRDRLAYDELMAVILFIGALGYALDALARAVHARWSH